MTNIYNYMRNTTRTVAREGILKYLEEYSNRDEIINRADSHLPLLRIKHGKKDNKKDRKITKSQFLDAFGRVIYENLNNTSNEWTNIIPFLSSASLLHSSTFLIDDIADKQEKRFDDNATWVKYGLNEAIFAAFRLREIAEKIIIDKQDCSLKNKVKILDLVSDIHRKTYEGQSLNDKLVGNYNHEIYLERCKDFGGVFCGCVSEGSAILANADEEQISLAKEIGNSYGIALMIRNDLKDFMTSELINFDKGISKALKRVPLEDFRIGRITYPLYIALSDRRYEGELRELLGKEELNSDEEKEIVSVLVYSKAFDKTIDLIENYKQKALEYWKELPENESKYILKDLIDLMKNSKDYVDMIKKQNSASDN